MGEQRPRVFIGIPSGRVWEPLMGLCYGDLRAQTQALGIDTASKLQKGCYVTENRNRLVEIALDSGATHLCQIDTDMVFPPNSISQLLSHGKDIIGVNYRGRSAPYEYLGRFLGGGNEELVVHGTGLNQMEAVPGGFHLVKLDVYRAINYPWYKQPDGKESVRDEVWFCQEARKAGFEIWCDMDLTRQIRHIGEVQVPWFGVPCESA